MTNWLERTELLLGNEKLDKLKRASVLVVGLGGVGAYAAEQLCRAGIGSLTIVDSDAVETTNRNRQLPALVSTTGKLKTEVLAERFLDINPDLNLTVYNEFVADQKTLELLQSAPFDYVVDAIDTLSPKVYLIARALELKLKIVSSMGAGGKTNPELIHIADISNSHSCRLARTLRKRLLRMGIKNGVQVVFSSEIVCNTAVRLEDGKYQKSTVGTISYMPALFGCFVSSVVIRGLIS